MRPIGDSIPNVGNATQIVVARARASQKLKPASGLHAQTGGDAHPDTGSFKSRPWTPMCHSGTERNVPFRYGMDAPQWNAAFVAQLLGQVMPDREPRPSGALAAYDEIVPTAQLCDAHL